MKTAGDPAGYAAVARAAVHELDPNQPTGRMRTMPAIVSEAVARQRFTMFLAGVFATVALVLSLVGLYGVVSFSVAERTHEIGLRYALGATPGSLVALVLTEGMRLVAVGVGVGLAVRIRARALPRDTALRRHRSRPRHLHRRGDPSSGRRHCRLSHPGTTRDSHRSDDGSANAVTGGW